jgi:hypothetical protein
MAGPDITGRVRRVSFALERAMQTRKMPREYERRH